MYQNFGCSVGSMIHAYELEVTGPPTIPGRLSLKQADRIDLRLPWLQHTLEYAWQREMNTVVNGSHRQYVFEHDGVFIVGLAVNEAWDPVRIDCIAYQERLLHEEFSDALQLLAKHLGKDKFVVANEPESSGFAKILEAVGKRKEIFSQHLLELAIEHK